MSYHKPPDYTLAIIFATTIVVMGGILITAGVFWAIHLRDKQKEEAAKEVAREAIREMYRQQREDGY